MNVQRMCVAFGLVAAIENELRKYDPAMLEKPRWLVLNKADLLSDATVNELVEAVTSWGEGKGWIGPRPLVVSAATSRGKEPLLDAIWRHLDASQSS